MGTPELSIIVAAQSSPEETARCLDSLSSQSGIAPDSVEVIVATQSQALANMIGERFPKFAVELTESDSLPWLHGAGMNLAHANLIAVTEGHCTFPSNWAAAAIAVNELLPEPVIGGAVVPAADLDPLNFGLFICDYAQFMPPLKRHRTFDLPGNNIVFKRRLFADTSTLVKQGFWKTFFVQSLEAGVGEPLLTPELQVTYNRKLTLPQILLRRYHHGRCFGGMRAAEMSPAKRVAYVLAGPLIPLLIAHKLQQKLAGKQAGKGAIFRSLPAIGICIFMWAVGEWIGAIAGSANCCNKL